MNTNNIKTYAPKARTDFIAAVTKQAARYGITDTEVQPVEVKGDIALINGRPFPVAITKPRADLVQLIEQKGFNIVIEQVAYSWFNRLCAIRYMELHDYLGHGRRVLSHPEDGGGFQILEDCLDVDLPGLDQAKVRDFKVDGTKDEELYRELLLAQCHALHQAMPFLFEPVDDATELLLPENLTKTDSLIRELVNAIAEEDWTNIEIIGWLYQFYISEKKDEVIGKVVKSEDIPAATQLFTPNWIVKYMVQNSLGAQWLATYPDSPLKAQMEYYIEPAEQTGEVSAQLSAITPSQLNPEELTFIDPASGSGHILVEAYDLFKAIYLERGYRQRDIAQLILQKNLFGLDIDERAAQLSGFALMMKARADDRRLFDRSVKLNVMALQDSTGFDPEKIIEGVDLVEYGLKADDLTELKRLFEYATTFGSLIQVPEELAEKLPALKKLSETASQDLFVSEALKRLGPLVQQAKVLAVQYDAVVTNPPYLGSRGMNAEIKIFLKNSFKAGSANLYAAFILRCIGAARQGSRVGMITLHSWMFLPFYENVRKDVLHGTTINSVAHLGAHAFREISGEVVQSVAFTLTRAKCVEHIPTFIGLVDAASDEKQTEFRNYERWYARFSQSKFDKLPGEPIAYWLPEKVQDLFVASPPLQNYAITASGLQTSNNDRFLRQWFEAAHNRICFTAMDRLSSAASGAKWFPYNKGGGHRRWYGNHEYVVNWGNDGEELYQFASDLYGSPTRIIKNTTYYFKEGFTWSVTGSAPFAPRYMPRGFIFDVKGSSGFPVDPDIPIYRLLSYLSASITPYLLAALNPTQDVQVSNIAALPLPYERLPTEAERLAQKLIGTHKLDWDSSELSWDFRFFPIMSSSSEPALTLESSYEYWITQNRDIIAEVKSLEEENNRLLIDACGLGEELTPGVAIEQITLTVNPAYRYGGKLEDEEQWIRFRQDTMEELVSYAIGCMMGRYSLDAPGLIYANSGNEGFDACNYATFPADDDGIIPLTSMEWFDDDAANRLEEFIGVAWDSSHLEQNLAFLADNLSPKRGEGSRDTMRRYLSDKFFKDHLQTYKKRPIYWLFSSGKEKAFQCLVYLHRYNEGTLARMRTEYVIPLTAKLTAYVDKLEKDKEASGSTAEIKKLEKQITKLHKQQAELSNFDEKLRHYADQRIKLELDDGVKVNYGKFGDLLAEVKAVTGKKSVS
jgi:type II restriction/modification system DNA methylase subunit YeeA